MTPEEFVAKSAMALTSYATEMNSMETSITNSGSQGSSLPSPSQVFETMSDAAQECQELLEHYDDERMPRQVRDAMISAQASIKDLASALKLHVDLSLRSRGT